MYGSAGQEDGVVVAIGSERYAGVVVFFFKELARLGSSDGVWVPMWCFSVHVYVVGARAGIVWDVCVDHVT